MQEERERCNRVKENITEFQGKIRNNKKKIFKKVRVNKKL